MLVPTSVLVQRVTAWAWIAVAKLAAVRTGWLARTCERAGLIGNGPTYLARDTHRPDLPK